MGKLEFYGLSNVLSKQGIVVNGAIYHHVVGADDAFLEIDGKRYDLRFQGIMEEVQAVEELTEKEVVDVFKKGSLDMAVSFASNSMLRTVKDVVSQLLIYQCLGEVLPLLTEFDKRVNEMPESDLVKIRGAEITGNLPEMPVSNKRAAKRTLKEQIERALKDNDYRAGEEGFDFKQTFLFMDEDHDYELVPRKHRGDIIFFRNGKSRLFKRGEEIKGRHISEPLKHYRSRAFIDEVIKNDITDKLLESMVTYLDAEGVKTFSIKDKFSDFYHNGAGMRHTVDPDRGGAALFVYVKPWPYAMHDIREGHTHKWYPIRDPPELGVFVRVQDGDASISHSAYVYGEISMMNIVSQNGRYNTFCTLGKEYQRKGERWQESVKGSIMFGLNILLNGMTQVSLKNYGMGEGYRGGALSKKEWITYEQVLAEGLLETNLHAIVPMINKG